MPHIVYGVFANEAQADQALAHSGTNEPVGAAIQHGRWRDEEVQIGGSQALSGAITMGALVGIAGALFAWMFLWPTLGIPLPAIAILPMALAGASFGVVAGAVAGAAECKTNLRALAPEVEKHDRVVVTCEVETSDDAVLLRDAFENGGGTSVHAA